MRDDVRIEGLRTQVPEGVLAIGRQRPRLTWRVVADRAGVTQSAYEIEAGADPGFAHTLATTGVVVGDAQVGIPAPGPDLRSRESRWYHVRIAVGDEWTAWSEPALVEAGLLDAADWVALAITLPDDPGARYQAPAPMVRRAFDLPSPAARARLHVTALGCQVVSINGRRVSDELLAPGWTPYARRLLADTYDVTDLLDTGANVIGAMVGDGWYRGRLGWDHQDGRRRYGDQVGLVAQLEIDLADGSAIVIATDGQWQATTGEIRSADLYDGSLIDLRLRRDGWDRRGFDASDWLPAATIPIDPAVIEPRSAPPVRVIAAIPVEAVAGQDGVTRIDGGQNVAGYLRLHARGRSGDRLIVRHAEVLDPDGSLHTRALRSAKATDTYILGEDGDVILEPAFTFHGFQFAEVTGEARLLGAEVIAISSDTQRRGTFQCADRRLTRFHDNVVWSQRDNFVSVPTDCPQRDERLGWTGDAQAFAATASTLFSVDAFWASWLRDLALEQDPVLGVSSVVPDMVIRGQARYGRAGWGDAATIVPWAVYEAYGDAGILADQWDSMVLWVQSLADRRGDTGLIGPGMQFGDWLDPDAPAERPWEAKTDSDFLANAFFACSSGLLAAAAAVLGRPQEHDRYRSLADDVADRTWRRWGAHAITTQTGCAVALAFRLCPDAERPRVAAALGRLVRAAGGRVATGFLGTPLVLPALADAGLMDEAFLMLLCRDLPSWLYQVDKGASTVWERWDAIRPDGSIHPGTMSQPPEFPPGSNEPHMLSFNHYAYGAVVDWVYRHVAGIAPVIGAPGYREVRFAPTPSADIGWARASVDAAYGRVSIDWRLDEAGDLVAEIDLPFGTTGTFVAPTTDASLLRVDGEALAAVPELGPGHHLVVVTAPRVVGPVGEMSAEPAATPLTG